MKLKYYLRGLGIGVLVTTIILTIAHHAQRKMSDADIIERAKELGMVMEEDTLFDDSTTKEEQTTTKEPTKEPETTEPVTEESTTKEPVTEEPTTKEPVTEEPTTKEPATEKPTGDLRTVTFTVTDGMYSEAVTDILYKAGIITNKAEFNSFLEKNGYSRIIQNGKHTVNSSMSYEEIAKVITKTR